MEVDLEQARMDLEKLDAEVASLEDRLTKKHAERSELMAFLRVAETYQAGKHKSNGKARPTAVKVVPAITLHRDPAKRQTIVATRLVERYEPGEIFTIREAVEHLGSLPLSRPKGVSEIHHLSSFLSREADARNGVLERINRGKYRLRSNAQTLIFPTVLTTQHNNAVKHAEES